MKQYRVSLKIDDKIKDIFSITYTSDGGFFFQDKVRINFEDKKCMIIKLKSDVNHHGIAERKIDYSAVTSGDVKMTHHLDGKAHISGEGVTSGYDDEGSPKGAAIESFKLTKSNDGGKFWCMSLWGFDSLRDTTKKSIILIPDDQYIHSHHHEEYLNAYEIMAIYLLKDWLTPEQLLQSTVVCQSPIEGRINVTLVPSPTKCPGIIGLWATRGARRLKSNFGFTMSGAPGKIDRSGFCDGLSLIYPAVDVECETENLDFL